MISRSYIRLDYRGNEDQDQNELTNQAKVGGHGPNEGENRHIPKGVNNIWQPTIVITYKGRVYNLKDALLLFEATRLNILPTINRRLTAAEKSQYIRPNTVFIWNETQCGMKRWTDGKIWSPSKVHHGSFLIYKQLSKDGEETNLIKQSISILTKQNQKLHLICYYDKNSTDGATPSADPKLKDLQITQEVYPDNLLPPKKPLGVTSKSDKIKESTPKLSDNINLPKAATFKIHNSPFDSPKLQGSTSLPVEEKPVMTSSVMGNQDVLRPNIAPLPTNNNPHLIHSQPNSHQVFSHKLSSTESLSKPNSNPELRPKPSYQRKFSLPPPPPPQPSHYRLCTDNTDSQTLNVLDKGFP